MSVRVAVPSMILEMASSAAFLDPDQPLRRLPRQPRRQRPAEFDAAFEDRALAYDCFWHHDGQRALIAGPPPLNLWPHYRLARYRAMPSGTALPVRYFHSLSVMLTELAHVPPDTSSIVMSLGGEHEMMLQPSLTSAFAGRRMLFTINKDNDLAWIAEWARYHAAIHGTDAVVLFDNGSSRYRPAEVAATLAEVPGIALVAVPSWPHKFGPIDRSLRVEPYWSRFLQIASMSVVLRRCAARAEGMLDCDIDELAAPAPPSIYHRATRSRGGLIALGGRWVEAAADAAGAHRVFAMRLRDPKARQSRPRKWVLDPQRDWVKRLSVHPYWHFIRGRPLFAKETPSDVWYWHFRGINTGWKRRAQVAPAAGRTDLEPDPDLASAFAKAGMPGQ